MNASATRRVSVGSTRRNTGAEFAARNEKPIPGSTSPASNVRGCALIGHPTRDVVSLPTSVCGQADRRGIPRVRAPHFHPAVAHPHLEHRLGVGGGAAQGSTVREAITARVPRADDTAILDPAVVERTALMSTSLEERVQRYVRADEQNHKPCGLRTQ